MIVYVMISKDRYELPLIVADTQSELARLAGVKVSAVSSGISKTKLGKLKRSKYIKVEIDDD